MTDLSPSPANSAAAGCSPQRPDAALLQAWAAQSRSADFTELVRRHIGLVRGIACRQLGEEHADDTTQTVFAILARKASSLTGVRSLSAWLHRVTILQCRSAVRRLIRERRSRQAAMENALLSSARDPIADALPHLDTAIDALRESDHELILMRYSEGLSFAQASIRTGRSEAALRQQAVRALETLTVHLRRRGVTIPSAALASGLGHLLHGPGKSEAATLCGQAALAAASKLTAGSLAGITIATMSTIQSILAGGAAALLLVAGPVLWRTREINAAEKELGPLIQASGTSTGIPQPAAPASNEPAAAKSPASIPNTSPPEPSGDLLKELEDVFEKEMKESFAEWARGNAWLEARRTGRVLGLSPQKERALRSFVEEELLARVSADGSVRQNRRDYQAKLEKWYAENLTPEQNTARQSAEKNRTAALVERLAEDALHRISSVTVLTEDQKTKLYEAAAAKAAADIAANDYEGSVSMGASFAAPPAPALEDTAAAAIAAVLEPAQLELWEQSREQDRLFNDILPRRVADRTLAAIRQRGLGDAVMSLIREAMKDE